MLITDSFIMLNLPKTASTFARKVIKKAYGEYDLSMKERLLRKVGMKEGKVTEIFLPNIKMDYRKEKDQHGVYDQIPPEFKNSERELVSIIRNPYDAYVSRYTFESWKRNRPVSIQEIKKKFPNYPDLSFREYLEYTNSICLSHRLNRPSSDINFGTLSAQFIQMFSKEHKKVLLRIDKDYRVNGLFEKHFPDITFLKTETINDDLFKFLLKHGFSEAELSFIHEEEKVNVSRNKPYEDYLDESAKKRIVELEWLLFDLFPDYNQ